MNQQDNAIPATEITVPAVNDPQLRELHTKEVTPAQARVEAVADALKLAYANASKLTLTPEEAKALSEDFPDEAFREGAGGDNNLIYIEHAYLRQRLNNVLGVGAVVPIRRREWAEEFTYWKDNREKKAVKVYADVVLLARGCVVGEAIGDAVYYPDNAKSNYSDALESAKSNAFRRCCKEFGVGLQAWMKGWCEEWKQRNRSPAPQGRSGGSQSQAPSRPTAPTPQRETQPAAKTADVVPQMEADKDQRFRFLAALSAIRTDATSYFVKKGWLTSGQNLEDLPNKYVPTTKKVYDSIMGELQAWVDGEQHEPEWRSYPMPWGTNKDTPLADLDKKYLFGLFMNFEVEREYNGNPKKPETIAKDEEFRKMLDAAGDHYEWKRQ